MKVLIMSHNPITDYNNMGKTFLSLFEDFSSNELCQFYIYPTIPNVKKCGSYFRITDKDALKNIFSINKKGREISIEEIKNENSLYENESEQNIYKEKSSHKELKLVARNFIWKLGGNTKKLDQWIKEQKPDVIFAAAGLSSFFYDFILKISKKHSLPIVSYVCDDFYFSSELLLKGVIKKVYYKALRKKVAKLMRNSKTVTTICDSLGKAYQNEFGCNTLTVSTGATIDIASKANESDAKVIRYFGNLQLGRNNSLLSLGKALDKINEEQNSKYSLEIYTDESRPDILQPFSEILSIQIKGFVSGDEVHRLMKDSLALVHTESFESKNIERVRFSVSTKIADSLASGTALLAFGPAEVASMEYLIENEAAFCATSAEELTEVLKELITNKDKKEKIISNALESAKKNHDSKKNSVMMKETLEEACR